MSNELDEILNLEPKRSVASVAPISFFIGTAMGGILAVFGTLYASFVIGTTPMQASTQPVSDAPPEQTTPPADASFFSRWLGPSTRIVAETVGRPAEQKTATDTGTEDTGPVDVDLIAFDASPEAEAAALVEADESVADLDGVGTSGGTGGAAVRSVPVEEPPDSAVLEAQVLRLRRQLEEAEARYERGEADREALRRKIVTLTRDLEQSEERLQNAREEVIYNKWVAFLEGAKNRVCGQYGRSRSDRCRASVNESLLTPAHRERFAYCLRSGQPEPYVDKLRRGAEPPSHGRLLEQNERTTRSWMVVFCDETLPSDPDSALAGR